MTGYTVKVPQPPEGLTVNEQARWWHKHPTEMQVALTFSEIPAEVLDEVLILSKDADLAFKVIDPNRVSGVTKEERARLFELLTGGGVFDSAPAKRGAKRKTKQKLQVFDAMDGLPVRPGNQAARLAAGDKYHKSHGNISKLKKQAVAANDQRQRQEGMLAEAKESSDAIIRGLVETEEEFEYWRTVFNGAFGLLRDEDPDMFDEMMHRWFPEK